jgi:hypothetical protein
MTPVPVWLVALVLAALAPWAARALERALVQRQRRRTLALLAQALPQARATDAAHAQDVPGVPQHDVPAPVDAGDGKPKRTT